MNAAAGMHAGDSRPAHAKALGGLPEGAEAVITANPDRTSREMGLSPGAHVRMLRNHRRDHAVVVALGDARFFVSRPIAAHVTLK